MIMIMLLIIGGGGAEEVKETEENQELGARLYFSFIVILEIRWWSLRLVSLLFSFLSLSVGLSDQ